jgi:hypothetical protein
MAVRNVSDHLNLLGGFSGINNPGARVYYVAATTAAGGDAPSDNNTGLSPQSPFSTIQAGLDAATAARGDTVAVLPGSYTITAPLTMTKSNVKLVAVDGSQGAGHQGNTAIVCSTDSVSMLTIDAAGVTVQGFRFDHNTTTAAVSLIDVGGTTASPGAILRNLFVDMEGSATDTDGINLSNCVNSVLEGITVHDYDQDGIVIDAGCDEITIRDSHIYDGVSANSGQYGVSNGGDGCWFYNLHVQTDGTAGLYQNGTLNNIEGCHVWATGAGTICILMAASATQSSRGCFLTAAAAGNLCDYTTDNTSPSADANISGIFAATPGASAFDNVTVGGA